VLNVGKSAQVQTGRSVIYSKKGGAAASAPLAVSAAITILNRGGSFIDAGIALSAVICVVEPGASHLGHVFKGEGYGTPTDERWCINSVSLRLEAKH